MMNVPSDSIPMPQLKDNKMDTSSLSVDLYNVIGEDEDEDQIDGKALPDTRKETGIGSNCNGLESAQSRVIQNMNMVYSPRLEIEENKNDHNIESDLFRENEEKNDEVAGWLKSIGMGVYYREFVECGFDAMSAVKDIDNVPYLRQIGVLNEEHQKRIFKAIQKLSKTLGRDVSLNEDITDTPSVGNTNSDGTEGTSQEDQDDIALPENTKG